MTDKGLLEALSDDETHSAGDLAGEQPLAVEELILQVRRSPASKYRNLLGSAFSESVFRLGKAERLKGCKKAFPEALRAVWKLFTDAHSSLCAGMLVQVTLQRYATVFSKARCAQHLNGAK
jgi:hypothetical protein